MLLEILAESWVWAVALILVVTGLVGIVVPVVPGHGLIFVAALFPWFFLEDRGGLEWWGLLILAVLLVSAFVVDFLSGAVGSRWFGGSRWGAIGAIVGGLVGLFFMPIGLLLGPLVGAVACEWLFAKQEMKPAVVSGWALSLSTITGLILKLVIGFAMAIYLLADVLWIG